MFQTKNSDQVREKEWNKTLCGAFCFSVFYLQTAKIQLYNFSYILICTPLHKRSCIKYHEKKESILHFVRLALAVVMI